MRNFNTFTAQKMNNSMKKSLFALITFCLLACYSVSGQDAFEVQSSIYKQALKNYDLQTATVALYNMQALKPERTDLNDSLALVYFAGEHYAQAYMIGERIITADPKRKDMLELVAVSKQNLGLIKESLADYEKLYGMDKSVYYLYQMATLQYQLKRFGECIASLDQILGGTDADKQKVNIRASQNQQQEVPMKAAAYNVKGICALEMNQPEIAKDNFNKALAIAPDFALAKGNLEMMAKKEGSKGTGGPAKTNLGPPTKAPGTK
jgi:tetratricopeptide (TPR) repeat protein